MKMNIVKLIPLLPFMCGFAGLAYADGIDEPIPSFYQEPGIAPTLDYVNQHASEHIDLFTGKLQYHLVDLRSVHSRQWRTRSQGAALLQYADFLSLMRGRQF